MTATDLVQRKDHKQENFPVASFIIKPRHRAAIMAFYRFARMADDVADHPTLPASERLDHLERMRATLAGETDEDAVSLALRQALEMRDLSPEHGLDLLVAFRQDVAKSRYADWDELIDYCRHSAMPVGRFVLDVHGEARTTWAANDALCAALQAVNHLQDCAKDYRELDRALSAPRCSPALRAVIVEMAHRTQALLDKSRPLASQIKDRRLAYEVALIQRLAEDLTARLIARDPLSERVHHRPLEVLGLVILAGKDQIAGRRRAAAVSQ
jgi:squalene synthase HpnC